MKYEDFKKTVERFVSNSKDTANGVVDTYVTRVVLICFIPSVLISYIAYHVIAILIFSVVRETDYTEYIISFNKIFSIACVVTTIFSLIRVVYEEYKYKNRIERSKTPLSDASEFIEHMNKLKISYLFDIFFCAILSVLYLVFFG